MIYSLFMTLVFFSKQNFTLKTRFLISFLEIFFPTKYFKASIFINTYQFFFEHSTIMRALRFLSLPLLPIGCEIYAEQIA